MTLAQFEAGLRKEQERRTRVAAEKEWEKRKLEAHRKAVDCEERSYLYSRTAKYYWRYRKQGGGRWTSW